MARRLLASSVLAAVCIASAHAQTAIDGDTIKLSGQSIRLFGIDPPERRQTCDDGSWSPGPLATEALRRFMAGRRIECHRVTGDRYGRAVSLCYADGEDLQALMVGAGWAWAFHEYSGQYADAERRAVARGVGVHSHRCQRPGVWRAQQR